MEDEKVEAVPENEETLLASLFNEITSPLNLFLLTICVILIYKIFRSNETGGKDQEAPQKLPKMKKQDMTLEQLRKHDGTGEGGRICLAVNGKVFDVTRGAKFYGPGGPYAAFGGHDATRAFATFSVKDVKDDHDDISDLSSMQMDSVREWEMQITEKYDYVGKLLKPGEEPTEYSEDEEVRESKKDM